MKTLIIYASIHHSNTEKIARVLAESLGADMIKASDANVNCINDYDLVGFGSGIYHGKPHSKIVDLVDGIPDPTGRKAFVFSTSGIGKNEYNDFLGELLNHKGFDVIGSFSCKGYDTYGPFKLIGGISKGRPNDSDFQKAEAFAQRIIESY